MIKLIKQLFKEMTCEHQFSISTQAVVYHIIEDTNKTKIKCDICGKIKDYKWVI